MTVLDEKGLRLARDIRAAMRRREEDADLQAAIEVYDRAVTPEERSTAASYLLFHSTEADNAYNRAIVEAFMRMMPRDLLPPGEQ